MTYYPNRKVSEFYPRVFDGLQVLKTATGVPKLTATSRETVVYGGRNNVRRRTKIIRKGPWRGMAFFYLTLEERTTCPTTCRFNVDRGPGVVPCYGANMNMATRVDHTSPEFESAVRTDVDVLADRYPKGFVVRLHELGDFFSVDYVVMWAELLERHHPLHIFGYSHRTGDIGEALDAVQNKHALRFNIMDSDAEHGTGVRPVAVVAPEGTGFGTKVVTCPEQTGRTMSCATCGLCMNGRTNIHFLPH